MYTEMLSMVGTACWVPFHISTNVRTLHTVCMHVHTVHNEHMLSPLPWSPYMCMTVYTYVLYVRTKREFDAIGKSIVTSQFVCALSEFVAFNFKHT